MSIYSVLARVAAFLGDAPDVRLDDGKAFRAGQFDAGLAWINHPVGKGGLVLPPHPQGASTPAMAQAGSPRAHLRNPIGYGNTAAVLVAHGTEECTIPRRYVRGRRTGSWGR
jgi:hypothetical protein